MEDSKQASQVYEFAFLLKTGETDAALNEFLANSGVTVVTKGPMTQMTLSYPINKQPSAIFGYYQITLGGEATIAKLTKDLNLKEYILRHLFVKVPKKSSRVSKPRILPTEAKAASAPTAVNLGGLSNENLEKTLQDILK